MRILPDMAVMMPISDDQRFMVESPSVGFEERNNRVYSAAAGVRYAAVAATSRVVIYIDTNYIEGRPSMCCFSGYILFMIIELWCAEGSLEASTASIIVCTRYDRRDSIQTNFTTPSQEPIKLMW